MPDAAALSQACSASPVCALALDHESLALAGLPRHNLQDSAVARSNEREVAGGRRWAFARSDFGSAG
jgi:hypothetical protein